MKNKVYNVQAEYANAQIELTEIQSKNQLTNVHLLNEFEKRFPEMIELYGEEPDSIGLLLNIMAEKWVKDNVIGFEGQIRCFKKTDLFDRKWPLIGYKTKKHRRKKPGTSHDHLLIFINKDLKFEVFGKVKKEDYNRRAIFSKFDEGRICIMIDFVK